jgi:hypothetical protein
VSAVERLKIYLRARENAPLHGIDADIIHRIHTGTDHEATVHLSDIRALLADRDRLAAEVARLREALRLIECQDQGCGGRVTHDEAWRAAQSIARAALAGDAA